LDEIKSRCRVALLLRRGNWLAVHDLALTPEASTGAYECMSGLARGTRWHVGLLQRYGPQAWVSRGRRLWESKRRLETAFAPNRRPEYVRVDGCYCHSGVYCFLRLSCNLQYLLMRSSRAWLQTAGLTIWSNAVKAARGRHT